MKNTAALILGYQRSVGVSRAIESLSRAGIQRIYLNLDGPKSKQEAENQKKILSEVNDLVDRLTVELFINKHALNLGLRAAVVAGIDWFFQFEKKGFIIEDDLVIDPSFFEFCWKFSSDLEMNDEILLISGNQFFEQEEKRFALKLNYPLIWGWFTTASKWSTIRALIFEEYEGETNNIPLRVKYFWKLGRWRAINGKVDSWAIPLAANFRLQGFFSIVPPVNLVSNIGNDKYASHTRADQIEMNSPIYRVSPSTIIESLEKPLRIQPPEMLEQEVYRIQIKHLALGFKLVALRLFKLKSKP